MAARAARGRGTIPAGAGSTGSARQLDRCGDSGGDRSGQEDHPSLSRRGGRVDRRGGHVRPLPPVVGRPTAFPSHRGHVRVRAGGRPESGVLVAAAPESLQRACLHGGPPRGGLPTSSSTLPSLVVNMYRHAMVADDSGVLVTTGTGYGTALMCRRLGDQQSTSVYVGPYLVGAASSRLAGLGLRPRMTSSTSPAPSPGPSTRSSRRCPCARSRHRGWTHSSPVAAWSRPRRHRAHRHRRQNRGRRHCRPDRTCPRRLFMRTRHDDDHDSPTSRVWEQAWEAAGEDTEMCRYPRSTRRTSGRSGRCWALQVPRIDYRLREDGDARTVWLLDPDGSRALATSTDYLGASRSFSRAGRNAWGGNSSGYATGSTARAPCPSTAPRSPSPRTAPPP